MTTPTTETQASKKAKTGGNHANTNTKNLRSLSHGLSWALRHAAVELDLTMTPDGYVPVDEILTCSHKKLRGCTLPAIQAVVETSDKQRFKLLEKPADHGTVLCIRANQGHTMSIVDPEQLLTRLEPAELAALPVIVHGTYQAPYQQIGKTGLNCMKRHHIHCAAGMPEHNGVISGMRKSCDVCIYIDGRKCSEAGITFYKSDNGVLLTAGVDNQGTLPVEYFSHVTDREGKVLLDQRGTSIRGS
jgi:2'-phosphotransferase